METTATETKNFGIQPKPKVFARNMTSRLARVLDGGDLSDDSSYMDGSKTPTTTTVAEEDQAEIGRLAVSDSRALAGFCVECEDQPASLFCQQCVDDYCDVCFQAQHRKGRRKSHTAKKVKSSLVDLARNNMRPNPTNPSSVADQQAILQEEQVTEEGLVTAENLLQAIEAEARDSLASDETFSERAKWIPLRLNFTERKALRLLEAALNVSEYTDKIDVAGFRRKESQRMVNQIRDLCAILCGLIVASDYPVGQELIQDKDFKYNAAFFQRIFETGRRHKIMNPEKMRTSYGKLVYLLMDAVSEPVQEMLEFNCVTPIVTVYSTLSEGNAVRVLDDPLMEMATREIIPDGKSRYDVQKEIKQKEKAIEILSRKYSSAQLDSESLKQCLYSIGDNNSFLRGNRDPIDKMIRLLTTHFSPSAPRPSLSIQMGYSGARLTHSHERQYYYVLQSLTLWREINHRMFKLWSLAEQDLLEQGNDYRLRDTGQGMNRLQHCPRISKEIHRILALVMQKVGNGNWVGSSVIHLGDTNVPNALIFIDKYTQVSRILSPIVLCIEKIDSELSKDPRILKYIQEAFGSVDQLKTEILGDFFRHGFDGSGADNFFDAGSCIDGRLTSAWNWCHHIEKKPYFPIFLLTGFIGFDGEFN